MSNNRIDNKTINCEQDNNDVPGGGAAAPPPPTEPRHSASHDIVIVGVFLAVVLVVGMAERMLPLDFLVPGARLGLSNIVIVLSLYMYSWRATAALAFLKCLLLSALAGGPSALIYSLAGSLLSLAVMLFITRAIGSRAGIVGVSVCGAAAHCTGQVAAAAVVLEMSDIFVYLIWLLFISIISGVAVGLLAARILPRINKFRASSGAANIPAGMKSNSQAKKPSGITENSYISGSENSKAMKPFDWISICIVAAISLTMMASTFAERGGSAGAGGETVAEIYEDGKLLRSLPMSEDANILFTTPWGENRVVITDGKIRISEANCAGQQCVHSGAKKNAGDLIVCAPNHLLISVKEIKKDPNPRYGGKQKYSVDFLAMDAPMSVTVIGREARKAEEAANAARDLVYRIDSLVDIYSADSEIYKLNANGKLENADPMVIEMLRRGIDYSNSSEGNFNIAIRPVTALWRIGHEDARIPSEEERKSALARSDYRNVIISGTGIRLKDNAAVDVGGIAKGYAADKIVELLSERGIADALISLGGNIYALGKNENGEDWKVGLQDPEHEAPYIGIISAPGESVVTSGSYERFSILNGKRYCHIIDPKTGYPVDNDLKSATIVSKNSTLADAYSTALFVMGLEDALAFHAKHESEFEAVFVTTDNEVALTSGLEQRFTLTDSFDRYFLVK
jgi:thiamine biosynthesis lipoprotein